MTIREETQAIERQTLSRYATLSQSTRGRRRPEDEDPIRPCYQRDRDRIIHCKAFRRLKQKTQVFLSPEGPLPHPADPHAGGRADRPHHRSRPAAERGSDRGHRPGPRPGPYPLWPRGERALNRLCPGGFTHYRQSLRVVDFLEKDGRGLNLTWEVRNGIVTHTTGAWARTPEGCVVRRADPSPFLNHDIEDAVTAGVLDPRQLPPEAVAVLGTTKSQRITTMITDLIEHSQNGRINFFARSRRRLRRAEGLHVQYGLRGQRKPSARKKKRWTSSWPSCTSACARSRPLMPNFYLQIAYNGGVDRAVTDYISGMSDEFATRLFEDLFVPQKWTVL